MASGEGFACYWLDLVGGLRDRARESELPAEIPGDEIARRTVVEEGGNWNHKIANSELSAGGQRIHLGNGRPYGTHQRREEDEGDTPGSCGH